MAYRAVLTKFLQSSNMAKPCLAKPTPIISSMRQQSSFRPLSTTDRASMFSLTMLKKYWEISPIIIIVGATVFCQVCWIIRHALTRDDVRYASSENMACEDGMQTDAPPVRKFAVYNQKYEVSPELAAALEALKKPTAEQRSQ